MLFIQGTPYLLNRLNPDPNLASVAFQIRRVGTKKCYDIHKDEHGWHCDCPSGCYSRENEQIKCKHVEAIRSTLILK